MPRYVALLRGINVGGGARVSMAELRDLAVALGVSEVQTYIQSGNLIFRASARPATLERKLEAAISHHFGLAVPVLVRTEADWQAYPGANPFLKASSATPNLVLLALSKLPLAAGAAEALQDRARDGEQVREAAGALWIHFRGGSGRSKLTPAVLDRMAASPVTTRNWRTVVKLGELLGG